MLLNYCHGGIPLQFLQDNETTWRSRFVGELLCLLSLGDLDDGQWVYVPTNVRTNAALTFYILSLAHKQLFSLVVRQKGKSVASEPGVCPETKLTPTENSESIGHFQIIFTATQQISPRTDHHGAGNDRDPAAQGWRGR
jgi:hypothetical protein